MCEWCTIDSGDCDICQKLFCQFCGLILHDNADSFDECEKFNDEHMKVCTERDKYLKMGNGYYKNENTCGVCVSKQN